LSIKNPKVFSGEDGYLELNNDIEGFFHERFKNAMPDFDDDFIDNNWHKVVGFYKKYLEDEKGYDGIIIEKTTADYGIEDKQFVAFNPGQIKIAFANKLDYPVPQQTENIMEGIMPDESANKTLEGKQPDETYIPTPQQQGLSPEIYFLARLTSHIRMVNAYLPKKEQPDYNTTLSYVKLYKAAFGDGGLRYLDNKVDSLIDAY
jgi:hypothetical protein